MKRLLLALTLAGCAAPYPRPDDSRRELQAARQQLARDEQALAGTQAEGRPVDCPRAHQLADNICMLSARICVLVEGLPRDPANTAQCTDARARCAAARERVKAACPK
jgi:hypothetical protein